MKPKRYSSHEGIIFLWAMIPYTVIINGMVFGKCFGQDLLTFTKISTLGIGYFAVVYSSFGLVAYIVRKRYPEDANFFRRIGMMLPLFYLLNICVMQGLYATYEWLRPAACEPNRNMEWWVTLFGCFASTVLTFVNEAAAGWDKWKASVIETEQLKNAYQKTKLLGLKGQVKPHFLFNCFNSLSSLMHEDVYAAEHFLNEMTRVHWYMLRSDDDQLTPLKEELRFANSYLYLIRERFGDAVDTHFETNSEDEELLLPPLTLQVILENIIYNNTTSRTAPLSIHVSCKDDKLVIRHTINAKKRSDKADEEEGLDNLIKKYQLLNNSVITINESGTERNILLPLIENQSF
ncbi:MAG: histidine kinase [Chitinophagaceae bacterium]|nr:MAG: histidine kinase [Chitinophagaceae bacterium]